MKITLVLVVPSFVVFYGWSALDQAQQGPNGTFAQVKPPDALPWPLSKWQPISQPEMVMAGDALMAKYGLSRTRARVADIFSTADILREAINMRIIGRRANELGILVSDPEVRTLAHQRMQGATREQVEAILRAMRMTEADFHQQLSNEILYRKVQDSFLSASLVSLFELWREYSLQNEEVKLEFVRIDSDPFREAVAMDEEEIQAYFEENREGFRLPDQRTYRYVSVSSKWIEDRLEITESDAREFYEENPNLFNSEPHSFVKYIKIPFNEGETALTKESAEKIEEIQEAASAEGADFDAIMTQYQTPPAVEGEPDTVVVETGDFGWVSSDDWQNVDPFVLSRARMLKVGDVSDVIRSRDAAWVIQTSDREKPELLPFEGDVIERARQQVRVRRRNEAMESWKKRFSDAVGEAVTLDELTEALGLEIRKTEPLEFNDSRIDPEVGSLPAQDREYLSMLDRREMSGVLTTGQGVMVVAVEDVIPTHLPEMDEVREDVLDAFRDHKALEQAKTLAEEALEAGKTLESLRGWAEDHSMRVETTDFFPRLQQPAEIGGTAENLANLTFKTPIGAVRVTPVGQQGYGQNASLIIDGYLVFRIKEIVSPSREKFMEEYFMFQREFVALKQMALMESWLVSAREHWKVKLVEQ